MEKTEAFLKFAKIDESKVKQKQGTNCVVYTRVSTKEQAENNMSLETQKKACEAYSRKFEFTTVAYFGGTYESAKNDERKEFNRMLNFVKKSRDRISYIIVYSVDRFSRSGANAIYIASELKKSGVQVVSVTQPTDTNTTSGSLQQNIQFIFSEYDNQLRREKTIAGMKEKLSSGVWVTKVPIGFDDIKINGERKIVVNAQGKLIKKAFEWKANEGLSNTQILERLSAIGLKLANQQIQRILINPFYCGKIVHNMLDGEVVQGKHERLVTEEVFLRANEVQSHIPQGWKHQIENNFIPLKRFAKCENCGRPMRGYLARKKNIHYYKCNQQGCSNNISAKYLHKTFKELLSAYLIDEKYADLIKHQIRETIKEINETNGGNLDLMKAQLKDTDKKMERLEERFILEEINKELYDKYTQKLKEERAEIAKELEASQLKVSNLEECVNIATRTASKLDTLWEESDYNMRQKLQNLVFPEGIYFNKKTGECRTGRINMIFEIIGCISSILKQKKEGQTNENICLSPWVHLPNPISNTFVQEMKSLYNLRELIKY